MAGGAVSAVALPVEVYLGAAFVYCWATPWRGAWPGILISLLAGPAGPAACYLEWRRGRRNDRPTKTIVGRMELFGFGTAFPCLIVFVEMIAVAVAFGGF